ncbi:MAG: alanine racemase [Spirochaetales bacterium]|nr:alanine racemase [Spirochaetales bacterium]
MSAPVVGDSTPDTPYIAVDRDGVERNIAAMQERIDASGATLRPHIKTHKIPALAHRQLAVGARGITCAKVSEAEIFAGAGVDDIFLAYPIVGSSRARRTVRLAERIRLICGVDGETGSRTLARAAEESGIRLPVRLEIDTGLGRSGVAPSAAVATARSIASFPSLLLEGIFTFRGSLAFGAGEVTAERVAAGIFDGRGRFTDDRPSAGREEGAIMVTVAEMIRRAGVPVPSVSVGSTPTAVHAASVRGVTEVRPGTYIFHDRMQVVHNVCAPDEVAATIRSSVVSVRPGSHIVIDAGSKVLGGDAAPGRAPHHFDGYGYLVEAPNLTVQRLSEEHGVISLDGNAPFAVGDIVTVVPNHICTCINLQNAVYQCNNDRWERLPVAARGAVQ